ncbi:unnamed protein product [Cylicocyclus nassatus]|uniref:DUF148 domain-containing protein n=1 Tax=Cylicocyclus nassatus TaxID=53992 RepID=A0AA36H5A0_CYLNA|nr:unnamed protein product [Cylicocyclus nassatus]
MPVLLYMATAMLAISSCSTETNESESNKESTESSKTFKAPESPEFLRLASDNARKEYIELETNMNVPLAAMRKAQDAWARNIGEPVYGAYIRHMIAHDRAKNTENARMNSTVAVLSKAAQAADQIIRGIYSNETLTKKQINAEVSKQIKRLPKKVYKELTLASQ